MYELDIQDMPDHIDADTFCAAVDHAVLFLGVKSNIVVIFEEMDNHAGTADFPDDGDAEITINNKASELEVIATVLHEMVHVRQMEQGKLSFCIYRGVLTWLDESYYTCNEEMTKEHYFNLPWEKEAYMLEEVMMRELMMGVAA